MSRKKQIIIIAVFAIIGAAIGVTYSWYEWVSTNTDVTLTIGGITITYEAGNDITDVSLRPVSTKEVGVEKNYAIKKDITVSSNKEAYFSLYLDAEIFPDELKQESLRWELYEGNTKLSDSNFVSVSQGDTVTLLNNSVINSTTRNLSLYIWIDGNMSNPSEMQNQNYKFVLNASATDNDEWLDPSGANHPELLDGMVPVTYRKCGDIEGVSEETYPECYTYGDYIEINDTDRAGLEYACVSLNMGTESECVLFIDELIKNGEVTTPDGRYMTFDDAIELYESNGGVMTSPKEVTFHSDKETSDLIVASSDNWYNYSNQKWANAVLVNDASLRTASAGTPIPEDNVLAYYVWIPRYKYKLFNANKEIGVDSYNAQTTGIDIVFERGTSTTGTVSCTVSSTGVETCENATDGNYYTHPAFWWDKDSDRVKDNGEELTGIWVGKFEISSSNPSAEKGGGYVTNLSVRIIPNVTSWKSNTVSNYFTVIQNMTTLNNEYGLNNKEADSHMMKNMEWGAVAYLTNSIYGRCKNNTCEEVTINNSSDFITGNGATNPSDNSEPGTTNAYDTVLGVKASTTGNIYGVYDMSGGSYEYVMGNMVNSSGEFYSSWAEFTSAPSAKYYDVYSYGETYTDQAAYSRGHLGDATGEVIVEQERAWNRDWASFVSSSYSWFRRGGYYSYTSDAGVFGFDRGTGGRDVNGAARSVLLPAPQN